MESDATECISNTTLYIIQSYRSRVMGDLQMLINMAVDEENYDCDDSMWCQ